MGTGPHDSSPRSTGLFNSFGSISRRKIIQYGAAIAGALALPQIITAMASASSSESPKAGHAQAASGQKRINFVLSHEQFPGPQLVEYGAAAEKAGFDGIWTSDHFHPWQDNEGHSTYPWLTLAALGQRSKQLTMGTGVTTPTFRHHPVEVAQAFASLGMFYPGRIFLGVGTGEAVNEQAATGKWGNYAERAARLVEAVTLIRQLWAGDWVTFNGKYYQTKGAHLYDRPTQAVPIYIAGNGPKSAKLAGQYGDGWITDMKGLQNQKMLDAFHEGLQVAGKTQSQVQILLESFVVVGDDKEAQEAAEFWRFTAKSWTKYVQFNDPRAINKDADQNVPLKDVYKDWPVSTDPKVHAQAIQKMFDAGATQVFIHSGRDDQMNVIDFYGKQVLPLVRSQAAGQAATASATSSR